MIKSLRICNLSIAFLLAMALFALTACGQADEPAETTNNTDSAAEPAAPVAEVSNLPQAPDFSLPAVNRDGTEISLSQFQDDKPVVLVFYRAYW